METRSICEHTQLQFALDYAQELHELIELDSHRIRLTCRKCGQGVPDHTDGFMLAALWRYLCA